MAQREDVSLGKQQENFVSRHQRCPRLLLSFRSLHPLPCATRLVCLREFREFLSLARGDAQLLASRTRSKTQFNAWRRPSSHRNLTAQRRLSSSRFLSSAVTSLFQETSETCAKAPPALLHISASCIRILASICSRGWAAGACIGI